MKRWLTILGTWLLGCLGCHPAPDVNPPTSQPKVTPEAIVDRLIEMGYLKYVSDARKDEVRGQLIETMRQNFLDSDWDDKCISADKRTYGADSEELAEGRIGEFILEMKEVLEREGVRLGDVQDEYGDEQYNVVINGTRHLIRTQDVAESTDIWASALKRHLEIVNELLKTANSRERLYAIYGGNDGRVILLTEEMNEYLHSLGDRIDRRWMPYPAEAIGSDGSVSR